MTLSSIIVLHGVDVGLQERLQGADAGIVDQHRDAGFGAEQRLDPPQVRLVVEVGRDGLDAAAGRIGNALRHRLELRPVARHEDEIIATARQPVGVDCADP